MTIRVTMRRNYYYFCSFPSFLLSITFIIPLLPIQRSGRYLDLDIMFAMLFLLLNQLVQSTCHVHCSFVL